MFWSGWVEGWLAVTGCESRGGVFSHFFPDSTARVPPPKHQLVEQVGRRSLGLLLWGMPPGIMPRAVFVFIAPRQPLDSARTPPGPWWPFTTRAHCLVSATLPGPLAVTATQRGGSAHACPVSLGGSAPAVKWATTDSHTASVSARSGHPKSSLVPGGCRSSRADLLEFHCAGDSPRGLVKEQILIQESWAGARESAFLLVTQMMPMPVVYGPQSE